MLTRFPKRRLKQHSAKQVATSVVPRRLWEFRGKPCIAAWNALGCAPEAKQGAPAMEHRRKVGGGTLPMVGRSGGSCRDGHANAGGCVPRGIVGNRSEHALRSLGSPQSSRSVTAAVARNGRRSGQLSGRRLQHVPGGGSARRAG